MTMTMTMTMTIVAGVVDAAPLADPLLPFGVNMPAAVAPVAERDGDRLDLLRHNNVAGLHRRQVAPASSDPASGSPTATAAQPSEATSASSAAPSVSASSTAIGNDPSSTAEPGASSSSPAGGAAPSNSEAQTSNAPTPAQSLPSSSDPAGSTSQGTAPGETIAKTVTKTVSSTADSSTASVTSSASNSSQSQSDGTPSNLGQWGMIIGIILACVFFISVAVYIVKIWFLPASKGFKQRKMGSAYSQEHQDGNMTPTRSEAARDQLRDLTLSTASPTPLLVSRSGSPAFSGSQAPTYSLQRTNSRASSNRVEQLAAIVPHATLYDPHQIQQHAGAMTMSSSSSTLGYEAGYAAAHSGRGAVVGAAGGDGGVPSHYTSSTMDAASAYGGSTARWQEHQQQQQHQQQASLLYHQQQQQQQQQYAQY
ncbi:hypothetical protein DFJ73DRAFT_876484, partial [Zopfochytrium polystomum]